MAPILAPMRFEVSKEAATSEVIMAGNMDMAEDIKGVIVLVSSRCGAAFRCRNATGKPDFDSRYTK